MHLLRVDTVSLDEGEAAVDLGQEPGDFVVLSFTDSDLAGLARAHASAPGLPSLRLAKLAKLRHPLSVDLYVDTVIAKARAVVIRCLGGLDYWRYGVERCAEAARANGVVLAVLPGDDRPDPRLAASLPILPWPTNSTVTSARAGRRICAGCSSGSRSNWAMQDRRSRRNPCRAASRGAPAAGRWRWMSRWRRGELAPSPLPACGERPADTSSCRREAQAKPKRR